MRSAKRVVSDRRARSLVGVVLILPLLAIAALAGEPDIATIVSLDRTAYFHGEKGLVTVTPGSYRVGAASAGTLRLEPTGGGEVFTLKAGPRQHEDEITEPLAVSIAGQGYRYVALVRPDGTGLEAYGSLSQTATRGLPRRTVRKTSLSSAVNTRRKIVRRTRPAPKPTLRVTQPAANASFNHGGRVSIRWSSANLARSRRLHIDLYQGNSYKLALARNTPNDGSHAWMVPATLAPGSYRLLISTTDRRLKVHGPTFTIRKPAAKSDPPRTVKPADTKILWTPGNVFAGKRRFVRVELCGLWCLNRTGDEGLMPDDEVYITGSVLGDGEGGARPIVWPLQHRNYSSVEPGDRLIGGHHSNNERRIGPKTLWMGWLGDKQAVSVQVALMEDDGDGVPLAESAKRLASIGTDLLKSYFEYQTGYDLDSGILKELDKLAEEHPDAALALAPTQEIQRRIIKDMILKRFYYDINYGPYKGPSALEQKFVPKHVAQLNAFFDTIGQMFTESPPDILGSFFVTIRVENGAVKKELRLERPKKAYIDSLSASGKTIYMMFPGSPQKYKASLRVRVLDSDNPMGEAEAWTKEGR